MNRYKVSKASKGTAVVSTRGLRRVVIQPGNRIVCELMPIDHAKAYANSYNKTPGRTRAEIVKYPN